MKKTRTAFNPLRVKEMLTPFYPSGDGVKHEQAKREASLRKKGKKNPACQRIAGRLESCSVKAPCDSGACSACGHALQALIAEVARRFAKKRKRDGTIVCVSVVPADGLVEAGRLNPAACIRAVRRWKERLAKAGVTWFVGAMDFSFNTHESGRYEPHWSMHFYGITVTDVPKALKRRLRKYFPKDDVIPVPVRIMPWDDRKKALRYIAKPNFWMRIGRDNVERLNAKTNERRKCRGTDKQRLPSRRKRELLIFLDQVGIKGRLLMKDCQLVARKGKRPRIVSRSPIKRNRSKVKK